jgi:hypothetical protein
MNEWVSSIGELIQTTESRSIQKISVCIALILPQMTLALAWD